MLTNWRAGRTKNIFPMIAKPNVARSTYCNKVYGIVVHFIMIYMMYLKRATYLFSGLSTSLTSLIITFTNHTFKFTGKLRPVGESTRSIVPSRISRTRKLLRQNFSRFFRMCFTVKRIFTSGNISRTISLRNMFKPRVVVSSFCHTHSWRIVRPTKTISSRLCTFNNAFQRFRFSLMRFHSPRSWSSSVPWNLTRLKSSITTTLLQIMTVNILPIRTNIFSTSTLAFTHNASYHQYTTFMEGGI